MNILNAPTGVLRAGVIAVGAVVVATTGFVSAPAGPAVAPEPKAAPVCSPAVAHGANRVLSPGETTTQACRYDTGFQDQSPSIQITREGVLFIARAQGGVLRSRDHGQTWQSIVVPALANGDNPGKGAHGYVHIDPVTQRLYYLTSMAASATCGGGGKGGAVVSWSDDLGASWHGSAVGCGTYDWGRMVTGHDPHGQNQRAVYFMGVSPRLVGGLRPVYRSRDGGSTWTRMANYASVTTEAGAPVAAPDGNLYFEYPEYLGYYPARVLRRDYPLIPNNICRQMVAVSEDFGETWRQEPIPNSQACRTGVGHQKVAVDSAGTLYVLWTDDHDTQVRMVTSRDKGRTWSAPINIMPPGATFNNIVSNIVAGEPGHVVISSVNTQQATDPRKWIINGRGHWHDYLSESFDADSASPHFQSVNLDSRNDPALVEGESPSEAEGYVGISAAGEIWASFTRHGGKLGKGSRVVAAHIQN